MTEKPQIPDFPTLPDFGQMITQACEVVASVRGIPYDFNGTLSLENKFVVLFKTVKEMFTAQDELVKSNKALYDFVNDYTNNLDFQSAVNVKIDEMVHDGTFLETLTPAVNTEITAWLTTNITNPSNPPIDKSLTVENAAADAKSTGNKINTLQNELNEQKIVAMRDINPYKMSLSDYDVVITTGKYLTGRDISTNLPTVTQQSDYPYDVIDIQINHNNTTITVPYDNKQNVGQAFVLYTAGVQSNNATPENVNKLQIGVINVTENNYTVNLNASHLNYKRVAFTVPKGRRDFYFTQPDEGELGKLIDNKITNIGSDIFTSNLLTACVNMFYSIGGVGDSYTAGSTLSSDGKWQDLTDLSWIATIAKRAGIYWSNYGKGGATTQSYITDKLPAVLSGQAKDLYFIALGINDTLQNLPIGNITDIKTNYAENGQSFYGWYGSIIAQIQLHAPKAKIVLVKIWTPGGAKQPYDDAIVRIAAHFNLPVINPYDDYFFNSSLYLNNMVSGHPTAMTYSSMGLAMERLFSKCVIDNPEYFKFATIG